MIKACFIITLLLFTTLSYGSPGWCKRAQLPVEKLICSDNDLSSLDKQLNKVYGGLRFELIGDKRHNEIEIEQRAWLAKRNSTSCDTSCLMTMYQKRIDELKPLLIELRKTSCERPKSSTHISTCAWQKNERIAKQLEIAFQNYLKELEEFSIKNRYQNTIIMTDFLAAKKTTFSTWKAFRDAKCTEEIAGSTAANGIGINKLLCLIALNEQRIKYYTDTVISEDLKR